MDLVDSFRCFGESMTGIAVALASVVITRCVYAAAAAEPVISLMGRRRRLLDPCRLHGEPIRLAEPAAA